MKWRIAESLLRLRKQVNSAFPTRSKISDGSIGDSVHASRASDHNPHVRDGRLGVVTALDITHDPENGCDAGMLAKELAASRDPRIKYIIYNKRMVSSYPAHGHPAWAWRPYSGPNPHTKHVHISVHPGKSLYDSADEWQLSLVDHNPASSRTHTVQLGETLSSIAKFYLGSANLYRRIMEINSLTSTSIEAGQVLVIPE